MKEGFERICYYTYPDYVGYGYNITDCGGETEDTREFGVYECHEYPVEKNNNGDKIVNYDKVSNCPVATFEFLDEAKAWAKEHCREYGND